MNAGYSHTLQVARPDHASLWVFVVFVGLALIDVGGALLTALQPFNTAGEILLIAAAAAIGLVAAMSFARALDAKSWGSRTVWIARGIGLIGASIAVWFPAILFAELRNYQTGAYTPDDVVCGEITASAIGLVYGLVPVVVSLRLPVAGGVLFLVNAAVGFVLGAFDPFGSFPERSIGPSIVANTIPPIVTGLALIIGGLAMRRAPREAPFGVWLRALAG